MTRIKFHGGLGKSLGKNQWDICVASASEALHAINVKTQNKLNRLFLEGQKSNTRFSVLINGEELMMDGELGNTEKTLEKDIGVLMNSNIVLRTKNLKTIDIIPIIEGSGDGGGMTILGALLMVASFFVPGGQIVAMMVFAAGAALVGSGLAMMMMQPPEFDKIEKIAGMTQGSYLFNGPVNIVREGNPIPLIYGEILAGSNVIGQYGDITHITAGDGLMTS